MSHAPDRTHRHPSYAEMRHNSEKCCVLGKSRVALSEESVADPEQPSLLNLQKYLKSTCCWRHDFLGVPAQSGLKSPDQVDSETSAQCRVPRVRQKATFALTRIIRPKLPPTIPRITAGRAKTFRARNRITGFSTQKKAKHFLLTLLIVLFFVAVHSYREGGNMRLRLNFRTHT